MRKKLIIVLTAMLAMAGIATPAHAAYTDCPKGTYCLWVSTNYTGKYFASEFSIGDYNHWSTVFYPLDRKASSAFNNGTLANIRAYKGRNYTGTFFDLTNPVLTRKKSSKFYGKAVRDGNLANGAGFNGDIRSFPYVSTNFDDSLRSHKWY